MQESKHLKLRDYVQLFRSSEFVDSGIYSKTNKAGMTVLKDMHDGKQDIGIRNNNPT